MSRSPAPPVSQRSIEHERAFRRWSVAASAEVAPELDGPASYRVYTPAELRNVPLRSSRPSSVRPAEPAVVPAAPPTLLHWLAGGMAIGLLLVTVGVILLSITDVPRSGSYTTSARLMNMVSAPTAPAEPAPAAAAPAPGATIESFELPDEAPAAKPRAKVKKAKLAVRDVPF